MPEPDTCAVKKMVVLAGTFVTLATAGHPYASHPVSGHAAASNLTMLPREIPEFSCHG